MRVEIGNDHAIEGYRDPASDDPELVRYRPAPGQRTTEVIFPEGVGLQEAFLTVVGLLPQHMEEIDADGQAVRPAWIKSDTPALLSLLTDHYGLTRNVRPRSWGSDLEA